MGGKNIDILYRKPKFYNIIYEPTNEKSGEILLAYTLLEKDLVDHIPVEKIKPRSKIISLESYAIGLRDIVMENPDFTPK